MGHRGGGCDKKGYGAAPYTKIADHRGGGFVKQDDTGVWKDRTRPEDLVEAGEEIPYYVWLAFPLEEVTNDDVEWAKRRLKMNQDGEKYGVRTGWKELIFSARRKDFRIDTFRAGGKGGQKQNKTDSGVRITHFDTGLSAESRTSRSQPENRKIAFRKLAKLLVDHVLKQEQREKVISNEVIRTYHAVDNRVKDHASGLQMTWKEVVEKPNLGPMIEARARAKPRNNVNSGRTR